MSLEMEVGRGTWALSLASLTSGMEDTVKGRRVGRASERQGPSLKDGSGGQGQDLVLVGGNAGQPVPRLCGVGRLRSEVPSGSDLWALSCRWAARAGGAQEPGWLLPTTGRAQAGREALQFVPTSQPSPRMVAFTHFRGPALAVGVVTTMHTRHRGQVAGGLITVTTLTTHRQKLPTHGQESCAYGLSRGCSGEEDWRRHGDFLGCTSGRELSCHLRA